MAKPIEPTPVLTGADAKEFIKQIDSLKYSEDKEKFLERCRATYTLLCKH